MASIPVRRVSDKLVLRDAPQAYRRAGRSVVPIALGRKAPSIMRPDTGEIVEIRWEPYQNAPAAEVQLERWFSGTHPIGIGIVTGPVSGMTLPDGRRAALEVLDIDDEQTLNAFLELAVTRTYKPLIKSLPFERTPGGGGHLGYLCAEWAGNTKLAERGVILTYEAVRYWCRKFGQVYANQLRRRRPRPGDKWHLDKVFLTIRGERHYLWRAVDQDGHVLDILVQRRRDMHAARKFFRKLLKGCRYVPRVIITDRLKSYGAAKREILPGVEHRQHRYLNNWAENSHQPTRHRERHMRGFKSPGHAQRFLSAYGPIAQHFRPRRHLLPAPKYRQEMGKRFHTWQDLTRLRTAA